MPMQQKPSKRRGEERSETLIIPHITKEMVETARRMAEQGATRAEIEQAIAAMQAGTPVPKKPIVQPQEQPAAPPRNTAAHNDTVIIPTSRPRYTQTERRAMLEEVQRRQAEREAARQAEARAEEEHFRTYRDREYGKPGFTPAAPAPAAPVQQPAAEDARTLQRRRQPRSRRSQHRSLSRLPRSPLPPLRQSTNGPLRPTATRRPRPR